MTRKVVGITSATISGVDFHKDITDIVVPQDYIQAVEKAGGIAIVLPLIENERDIKYQLSLCDAVIMIGGIDVNPMMYGEEPLPKMGRHCDVQDKYQSNVLKEAIEKDIPTLCVCRGMQLLNVVCGGTLYQDLDYIDTDLVKHSQLCEKAYASHSVTIEKGNILYEIFSECTYVNSYHHQSIKKLGDGLEIIARSKDGVIEAVMHNQKKFLIGLQWHPEMMLHNDERYLKIFKMLLA